MTSFHNFVCVAAVCVFGCGGASQQAAPPSTAQVAASRAASPAEGAAEPDVPGGTILLARAEVQLSSTYAHLGQPLRLRTISVLVTPTGEVLVPTRAVIAGKVTKRAGDRVWIELDTLQMEGVSQPVKARIIGAEAGFKGTIHAGDHLAVRFDGPVYSLAAVRARAGGTR